MKAKDQTHQYNTAKYAYKVMGLFRVGIKFSTRYNALYGPKDFFRHLVAMRGKHGYAEGSSRAEDIDPNSPNLPSGRWTLGKIRSIPEDKMLIRCGQMITRSIKRLRHHGLLRKPVDVAIDFHNICRYDKNPDMKFMRYSKHKNGTHQFNTLSSIHCITEGARACLGVLLRTREIFPVDAVAALLDMCKANRIRIRTLMLDREFYSADVMNLLNALDVKWLMPAVKTDTIKRAISEFENGTRGAVSVHSVGSGEQRAKFTLIIRPADSEEDVRETATGNKEGESESAYHVFATNTSPVVVGSKPDMFVEQYRRRWGIETAFRCYEEVRPRTTSRHESVRLLLLFFPMLLYNAWILARHMFERDNRITILEIFSRYLDVFSKESIRRVVPSDPG